MKRKFIKTAAAGLLAISALAACEHTNSTTSSHSCGKSGCSKNGCNKNDCGKNSCKKAGQKVEKSWWQR